MAPDASGILGGDGVGSRSCGRGPLRFIGGDAAGRGAVEKHLRRLGLWEQDRLTITVGNHDIFSTSRRGSALERVLSASRTIGRAQDAYEKFSEWVGELVPGGDRYYSDDLFPYSAAWTV